MTTKEINQSDIEPLECRPKDHSYLAVISQEQSIRQVFHAKGHILVTMQGHTQLDASGIASFVYCKLNIFCLQQVWQL